MDGKPESRTIDSIPGDKSGGFDRIGDRRARVKIDVNAVLHHQRCPGDRNPHGLLAWTDSARRTKASISVFATWLKTGPSTVPRTGVANS